MKHLHVNIELLTRLFTELSSGSNTHVITEYIWLHAVVFSYLLMDNVLFKMFLFDM
jgi:hypothetical protein